MKKTLFSLTLMTGISGFCFAQVGIGTENPLATLDVNGNIKVRNISEVTTVSDNYFILMQNNSVSGDSEVIKVNAENLWNSTSAAYSAEKQGGWSLLNVGIAFPTWRKINLTGATDTELGNPALFTDGVFTAPSSGVYNVNYEFQFASGIDLSVLGGKSLGLIKNGTTLIEQKTFDGVKISLTIPILPYPTIDLASVPVTSTNINELIFLNQGETLTFAVDTGGMDISLLTENKVSLYLYKVAN